MTRLLNAWQHHVIMAYNHSLACMQVRERMRTAKDTLQKLNQVTIKPAPMFAAMELAAENNNLDDDRACAVCLERAAAIVFNPCLHCVTCAMCAKLVIEANQPCPICRIPVVSIGL